MKQEEGGETRVRKRKWCALKGRLMIGITLMRRSGCVGYEG